MNSNLLKSLPALRPWLQHQGQAGLPSAARELERCSGLLCLEGEAAPVGGGVGICCQGRTGAYVAQALSFSQTRHGVVLLPPDSNFPPGMFSDVNLGGFEPPLLA